ncbi:MAG: hypothetical protein CO095_08150, partial [Armatimonadetes bacterium CG_4_9_14_3_um_filter_58_7]
MLVGEEDHLLLTHAELVEKQCLDGGSVVSQRRILGVFGGRIISVPLSVLCCAFTQSQTDPDVVRGRRGEMPTLLG